VRSKKAPLREEKTLAPRRLWRVQNIGFMAEPTQPPYMELNVSCIKCRILYTAFFAMPCRVMANKVENPRRDKKCFFFQDF